MRKSIDFTNISKKSIELYFDLTLTLSDDDIWGLNPKLTRTLLVSNLVEKYTYPLDNTIKIKFYVQRPVLVFQRNRTTFLDSLLKIGGLLGIVRLATIFISFLHFNLFKRDMLL